jgi:hypothetical protein
MENPKFQGPSVHHHTKCPIPITQTSFSHLLIFTFANSPHQHISSEIPKREIPNSNGLPFTCHTNAQSPLPKPHFHNPLGP